jgi:anti-sigma B factor antagonist
MSAGEFKHLRLKRNDEIMLIELVCDNVQGPQKSQEFCSELMTVAGQEWGKPLLLNLRRASYFSSMGLAAIFKMVKQAKEHERPVKLCNMHPDVRVGAEIVGLHRVVDIYDTEESAIEAFQHI